MDTQYSIVVLNKNIKKLKINIDKHTQNGFLLENCCIDTLIIKINKNYNIISLINTGYLKNCKIKQFIIKNKTGREKNILNIYFENTTVDNIDLKCIKYIRNIIIDELLVSFDYLKMVGDGKIKIDSIYTLEKNCKTEECKKYILKSNKAVMLGKYKRVQKLDVTFNGVFDTECLVDINKTIELKNRIKVFSNKDTVLSDKFKKLFGNLNIRHKSLINMLNIAIENTLDINNTYITNEFNKIYSNGAFEVYAINIKKTLSKYSNIIKKIKYYIGRKYIKRSNIIQGLKITDGKNTIYSLIYTDYFIDLFKNNLFTSIDKLVDYKIGDKIIDLIDYEQFIDVEVFEEVSKSSNLAKLKEAFSSNYKYIDTISGRIYTVDENDIIINIEGV